MFGEIFLNFSGDKTLTVSVKGEEKGIQIEIENGKTELQLRLSKEQAAQLRTALAKD